MCGTVCVTYCSNAGSGRRACYWNYAAWCVPGHTFDSSIDTFFVTRIGLQPLAMALKIPHLDYRHSEMIGVCVGGG